MNSRWNTAILEVRYRAAVLAESEQEQAAAALFDGETSDGAELRAILGRVNLGDYLGPAAGGSGISGAARELNEALELPLAGPSGGVAVPWRVLVDAGPLEARAFTTTGANDGPEIAKADPTKVVRAGSARYVGGSG